MVKLAREHLSSTLFINNFLLWCHTSNTVELEWHRWPRNGTSDLYLNRFIHRKLWSLQLRSQWVVVPLWIFMGFKESKNIKEDLNSPPHSLCQISRKKKGIKAFIFRLSSQLENTLADWKCCCELTADQREFPNNSLWEVGLVEFFHLHSSFTVTYS